MKHTLLLTLAACSAGSTPGTPTTQRLPEDTRAALELALADERLAQDTYAAVMAKHGEVRPFSNIIHAERRHEEQLLALFDRYDLAVPARKTATVAVPDTLVEACKQAIAAEKENIALYDRLIPQVTQDDIRVVFERLQSASRDRHLPAFTRCTQRGQRGHHGRGHGRGRGPSR